MTINLTIHWPQAIMVALMMVLLIDSIVNNGKPRESLVTTPNKTFIGVVFLSALLYWGGFFR